MHRSSELAGIAHENDAEPEEGASPLFVPFVEALFLPGVPGKTPIGHGALWHANRQCLVPSHQ